MKAGTAISTTLLAWAAFFAFVNVYAWRLGLSLLIRQPALSSHIRRRLVVIGGGSQNSQIQRGLDDHSDLEYVGWVQAGDPGGAAEAGRNCLGHLYELEGILQGHEIDIAVLAESESLKREEVLALARTCENEHVQFKMVPHVFEVLISGLRPENIAGISVLGVGSLPLSGYRSRFIKRTVDILGALIGLALAVPITIVCGTLVYWESPGPILYRQIRQGRNGRLFYIYKIRSMSMNAEADGQAQWAQENDPRRLRVGAFCRRWNLDEVPQFWNVLIGDMSLVGPRRSGRN